MTTMSTGDLYLVNSNGPSTLPCSTPDVQSVDKDCLVPTSMFCFHSLQPVKSDITDAEIFRDEPKNYVEVDVAKMSSDTTTVSVCYLYHTGLP